MNSSNSSKAVGVEQPASHRSCKLEWKLSQGEDGSPCGVTAADRACAGKW